MIKAVLFDFNGVLLTDGKWHAEAWNELSVEINNRKLSQKELDTYVHGRTPEDTLISILKRLPSPEEKDKLLKRKENYYQKIALYKKDFKLSADAIQFFEKLEIHGINKTLATSSPSILIEFYYKHLGLGKWFPQENIVFNDGTFPGKPAPDIFIKAASKLGVKVNECLVIEDAKSGIESAKKAGTGKIVLFLNGDNKKLANEVKVDKVISSFNQIIIENL